MISKLDWPHSFLNLFLYVTLSSFITKIRLFKYIHFFTSKNFKFSDKKFWYFSYFCSKYRFRYLLEPPHRGGSNDYPQSMFWRGSSYEYPQSMFWAEMRKIMYTPVNPSLLKKKLAPQTKWQPHPQTVLNGRLLIINVFGRAHLVLFVVLLCSGIRSPLSPCFGSSQCLTFYANFV